MEIEKIGHLSFKTHNTYVSRDYSGTIYCFKYTNSRCDMQSFTCEVEAADYILEPLPTLEFIVTVSE